MRSHRAHADAVPMGTERVSLSPIPWMWWVGGIGDGIAELSSGVGNKGVGGLPCCHEDPMGSRVQLCGEGRPAGRAGGAGGGLGTAMGAAPTLARGRDQAGRMEASLAHFTN